MSYLHQFRCPNCEMAFTTDQETFLCRDCNTFLLAEYDLYRARREDYYRHWDTGEGIWRFRKLLPVLWPNPVKQPIGPTPVYPLGRVQDEIGVQQLLLKDEGRNPGGTVFDREMAVVGSAVDLHRYQHIFIESSGSTGIAASRMACLADVACTIAAPKGLPMQFLGEYETYGANTRLLSWKEADCRRFREEFSDTTVSFDLNRQGLGLRLEGAKTLFYEMVDQLHPNLPEVVIIPAGEGTLAVGAWKAFWELLRLGKIKKHQIPHIILVEVDNCPTFHSTMHQYPLEHSGALDTIAPDLFFPFSELKSLIKSIIFEQNWEIVVISNDEILEIWKFVANQEGLILSPEGAACIAALQRFMDTDRLTGKESVLVVNPSNGIRHVQTIGFLKEANRKD